MANSSAITLGDLVGKLEMLRLECKDCDRAGQYRVLRLVREFGEYLPLPELRVRLTADCPRRWSAHGTEQCQGQFPDLSRLK
jgi:hypothetical protein